MAIQTTTLERSFRYNSVDLIDPGVQFTAEQVRDFYAPTYPEILNAAIEGPEEKDGKLVYTFRRAVGTKGAMALSATLEEQLRTHRQNRDRRTATRARPVLAGPIGMTARSWSAQKGWGTRRLKEIRQRSGARLAAVMNTRRQVLRVAEARTLGIDVDQLGRLKERRQRARYAAELTNSYVRQHIARSLGLRGAARSRLIAALPDKFISAKRLHLRNFRLIKESR